MSQRNQKGDIQNNPKIKTEYVTRKVQYAPTVVLPTKVYTSYSKPTTYGYTTGQQYNYNTQTKTTTTTTTNTTTETYNYPHTIYYSNGQYIQEANNNYSNANLQGQVYHDLEGRKTVKIYQYQNINSQIPQISTADQEFNNLINMERKTSYPQTNNLNLNNIYDINNVQNTNKIPNSKKTKNKNSNINYEYYNNNMYMVQSGNIGTQKQKTHTIIQSNPNLNSYYTTYNNQPQIINNQNNLNNQIYKTNINNQVKQNTNNNQSNAYMNNKITINNTKTNNNATISGYSSKPNNINYNNNDLFFNISEGILEEPPDNMRNKERKSNDIFNKTMPNLKTNNEISTTLNLTTGKNYSIQEISAFNITYNNTSPQIQSKNIIKKVKNAPPVSSFNIPNSNTNQNNVQNLQTQNNSDTSNMEYKDNYGNIYVLINGQLIDKKSLNKMNAINATYIEPTHKKDVNKQKNEVKNVQIDKNHDIYKNKDNVYYEEIIQEQTDINNPTYFDTYTGTTINNQNEAKKDNNLNINEIQKELNLQNNYQYNDYLNNTYPTQGGKVYKGEYLVDNNAIQNITVDQRNNRFQQNYNYTDINLNPNYNYNMDLIQNKQQQQQINNDALYQKAINGTIIENDIQTVQPQKPKKKRPVYKIPPSKKRAVSQGRSLAFIHKYYDENFILEEDNEDNASDSENKKQNKKLKNVFRQVTNIKRLFLNKQDSKENDNLEENEKIIINPEEEQNNSENTDNNKENNQNVNTMRLSYIRFSLDPKVDDNNGNKKEEKNNIENNSENEDKKEIIKNEQSKEIKENLVDSNISVPKNADSILIHKSSGDNNIHNSNLDKQSKDLNNNVINLDIYRTDSDKKIPMKESIASSINPNFYETRESGIQDSMLNSNLNIDKCNTINLNLENDDKDDKRISLNIAGHNLDKYFEKEGVNQRDPKQKEISTSLKTINLEEENRDILNSQLSRGNSGNLSRGNSKEDQLLTIDDALKGSVHIEEKIQNFVNKNNELYKDNNKK